MPDSDLAVHALRAVEHDLSNHSEAAVSAWMADWESAWTSPDRDRIAGLLRVDSHWRDLVAFSGTMRTRSGRDAVVGLMVDEFEAQRPHSLRPHSQKPSVRVAELEGVRFVETTFEFDTDRAACEGVVRLATCPETGSLKIWTFMTAAIAWRGKEEIHRRAENPAIHMQRDRGPNWLDRREASAKYEDRDPQVIVVGAGHAGLGIAARLTQLGLDTLVVERHARVGDNWRKRYRALVLHNRTRINHLPYMPFPETWPTYIPKDKLADWLSYYAEAMELNVWAGTEFTGAERDEAAGIWHVTLERSDGSTRTLRPAHLVLAPGVSAIPNRVEIDGIENFEGTVVHAQDFTGSKDWQGKRAVVIGSGTSAHDVAQELATNGVPVTMLQRSPTLVQSVEPTGQLPYTLYETERSVDTCDLITAGSPMIMVRATNKKCLTEGLEIDRELLDRLRKAGFRLQEGSEHGRNWQILYLTRGGGYYFNVGCSDLIADGSIPVHQMDDLDLFEGGGLRLKDGTLIPADVIVTATGYQGIPEFVRRLLGDEIADRVGQIWGIDDDMQELANVWHRTPQQGLWFMAGSFAQCRINSRYLALQIQADVLGLGH